MRRLGMIVGLASLVLAVPACNRTFLDFKSTFDVKPQLPNTITIDAVGRDQTVKVEVIATGAPVNVHLYLAKDKAEAEKAIESGRPSAKILNQELKTEKVKWEVPIPANHEAIVLVGATTKTANVTVTLKN